MLNAVGKHRKIKPGIYPVRQESLMFSGKLISFSNRVNPWQKNILVKVLVTHSNQHITKRKLMAKKKTWREKVNEIEEKIHEITPDWEKN